MKYKNSKSLASMKSAGFMSTGQKNFNFKQAKFWYIHKIVKVFADNITDI